MQKQSTCKISSYKENKNENVQEINEDQIIKMDEFPSVVFYDKCENALQDESQNVQHCLRNEVISSTVGQSQNVSLQADSNQPVDDMLGLTNENVLVYTNDNHSVPFTDENMLCSDDNSPVFENNTQSINAENVNFEIRNENWLDDNMSLNIVSVNVAGLQTSCHKVL